MLVALALLASPQCIAQIADAQSFQQQPYSTRNSGSFGRDFQLLSFSYGFPNWLYTGYGTLPFGPNYRRTPFGPLMARFEIAIRDEVGIGGLVQVASKHWRHNGYRDHSLGLGLGVMAYYHANKFIPIKELDVYGGAGLGLSYRHLRHDEDKLHVDNTTRISGDPMVVIGARYYFTPTLAAFAEGGYTGFSSLNLGVTLKL
jgi:hypothetical protein